MLALVAGMAACGGDGGGDGGADDAGPPGGDGASGPVDASELAPLPPAPELVAAQPCDGDAVLCVDASSDASGDGTESAPFTSVGDAVAVAGPGAAVQIAAGTYSESVTLTDTSDLALLGGFPAGGDFSTRDPEAEITVLQGTTGSSVVRIERSTGVVVEGLRLTGGGGFSSDGSSSRGGGVSVDAESSEVTIAANRIDGNAVDEGDDPTATSGGGVSSEGTGVRIVGNVVEANTAGRGSGISVQGDHVIDRNVVRANTSLGDHGGGLYVNGTATITANQVEGNEVGTDYSWGGGIIVYGDDTTATLRGNVVTANHAVSAGSGVFVDDGADATLVGELYFANECAAEGGAGLLVDSGGETPTEVTITASTIAQHDCPDAAQGGVAVLAMTSEPDAPPPVVTITDSILWGNSGRDVAALGAEVTVERSVVESGAEGDGVTGTEVSTDDPLFVDPAAGDLALKPGSPATGLGHTAAP